VPDEPRFKTTGPLSIDALVEIASPGEPHLSPDGSTVAFVLQAGEGRQIFAMSALGGWPQRITAGPASSESPRWSPDGLQVAFVSGKAVVVAGADGAHPRTLTDHAAGNSMPRWSPDGSQIAFYSRRRGWSQIWVIPAAGGEPRRLTDRPEDDDDLQWSPDGTQIAYSSIRGTDLNNRDIYSVDVRTGVERRLTDAPSCFDGAPAWSPDGRQLAFLSDQDGWVHVYLMTAGGADRRQLTSGPCEDGWPTLGRGHLLWSPDARMIAFVRNRGGALDLMTVDPAGGAIERINREDGFYQPVAWMPDGTRLLVLASRPDAPTDLWILSLNSEARQVTDSLGGGLHREDFLLPDRVSYASRDGLTISGFLYRPHTADPSSPCPAIVHPHGGPTHQAFFSWLDPIVQLFVQEGYAVLEPDFRGSSGYGRDFRLANIGAWGVGDAWDCIDGAGFLRGLDWVDGSRIGIWGGSYGGYLTLCCLSESPSEFRAGIDLFGDSEIAESYRRGDRVGRLDLLRQMGSPEENAGAYRRGSPVYRAERIEAPLLILHGRDDARVVPGMSERIIDALKIEGKFFEHQLYNGEGHGFRRPATRRDAYQRMLSFFEKYLKGSG
jgi:dipeptidyl aminopeptidase/acylaminoacyl peptidase